MSILTKIMSIAHGSLLVAHSKKVLFFLLLRVSVFSVTLNH